MPKSPTLRLLLLLFSALMLRCSSAPEQPVVTQSVTYRQINLVANRPEWKPQILEPQMRNAWGIAIRPAGAGGHFWVTTQATGRSIQYIGDVPGQPLHQDSLKLVTLKENGKPSTPTGVVYNPAKNFVITQHSSDGAFKSESKFLFATDSGRLYGWAEKQNPDGSMNHPFDAVLLVNNHKRGDRYFGLALDSAGERLYVADFGLHPQIRIFDKSAHEIKSHGFKNPFIQGTTARGGEFAPYNVQIFRHENQDRVFVTFARIKKKSARSAQPDPGEEVKGAGLGRLAEYDLAGNFIREWPDRGMLNAPWGMAFAPMSGFGPFSGHLLVGNFGDGTITAFDPFTFQAKGALLNSAGEKISIDGIWGLVFGNGASLGDAHQLYFAAGPHDEKDGLFGKVILDETSAPPSR